MTFGVYQNLRVEFGGWKTIFWAQKVRQKGSLEQIHNDHTQVKVQTHFFLNFNVEFGQKGSCCLFGTICNYHTRDNFYFFIFQGNQGVQTTKTDLR